MQTVMKAVVMLMRSVFRAAVRCLSVLLLVAVLATFPGVEAPSVAGGGPAGVPVEEMPLVRGMSLTESLSDSTWKVGNPSSLYDDVAADDPDWAAIKYVADAGVMAGTGARRFNPDGKVSYRTLSVVCMRAFLPDMSTRNAFEYMMSCGYLPPNLKSVDQYTTYVSWETAMAVVGRCAGVLPCLTYDGGDPDRPVAAYPDGAAMAYMASVGGELGVWKAADLTATTRDDITRRDLACILYDLNGWQDADPDRIEEYGFGYVSIKAESGFANLVASTWADVIQVPYPVLKFFRGSGFGILLDDKYIEQYQKDNGMRGVVGLFSTATRTLYIRNTNTALHEFGHFVDSMMVRNDSTFMGLYESEKDDAAGLVSSYSGTSASEFFAETFAYYMLHRYDGDVLDRMRARMPETYSYFSRLEKLDWYLGGGTLDAPSKKAALPAGTPESVQYGTLNDPPLEGGFPVSAWDVVV